ncbi:MAG: DUF4230 domain-containing protein [Crocinitomicaceae bacterium]|nr:DUF4230 domain-containing protein [Crocinitomicaceae bacterium]
MKAMIPFLLSITLLSCSDETKTPPIADIYEIRDLGILSTTEYTIGKIIQLEDLPEGWESYYKIGERKLLISCKAKVKAGVDLRNLKKGDIKVNGNTIRIKLPPSKITSFTMDPKDVRTEMESITGFRDGFTQSDKNNYLRQGEESIKEDLQQTSLLKDADKNARVFLNDFYKQMGFDKVVIIQEKEGGEHE